MHTCILYFAQPMYIFTSNLRQRISEIGPSLLRRQPKILQNVTFPIYLPMQWAYWTERTVLIDEKCSNSVYKSSITMNIICINVWTSENVQTYVSQKQKQQQILVKLAAHWVVCMSPHLCIPTIAKTLKLQENRQLWEHKVVGT